MPQHTNEWDDNRHGCSSDDWQDDGDWQDDDRQAGDEPTMLCPYCRREIFEDAPQCPHCGSYISEEDARPERKPWWIIVGALLCLAVVGSWIASWIASR
jgi:predicted amidophosphoribosyltransferase